MPRSPHATGFTALGALTLASLSLTGLSACVPNNQASTGAAALSVSSTDTECAVSANEALGGNIVFTVTNNGDQVTEFYLLASDKLRIEGEVENIGPGISRDLVVSLEPGDYFTACKPGMVGAGVGTAAFAVTDSGTDVAVTGDLAEQVAAATTSYKAYVEDQIEQLVTGTEAFTAAYVAGDDALARDLYASTRVHWERVETVAESFGDLDPRMDLREADLEEGQDWTGWHAIEKDLWPAGAEPGFIAYTQEKREALTILLVADTATLLTNVRDLEFGLDQLANGAIGLLDEVATGKVTGEEEFWSHTDLWDFQANIDGARVLYDSLRDMLGTRDEALTTELDEEFAALQVLLDSHRDGDGFDLYTDLSTAEVRALSDAVNALAEPLSRITGTLVL